MCAIASEPSEASAVRRREGPLPEKPLFTVELVIFTIRADRLHVLLVERADQPRKGWWALPGGVLDPRRDDSIEACALRKLAEEAGVHPPYLEQLKTYGSRDRDPRGWTATTVYFALMASERVQLGGNQAAGEKSDNNSAQPGRDTHQQAQQFRNALECHSSILPMVHQRSGGGAESGSTPAKRSYSRYPSPTGG